MWTQWEECSTLLDTLLRGMEDGLPRVHLEEDKEEQILEKLSVCQVRFNVCSD